MVDRLRNLAERRGRIGLGEVAVILLGALTLGGILLHFLTQQREVAERMKCGYNLKLLGDGIQSFADQRRFLPPARLADDYATWFVLLGPHVAQASGLEQWDESRPFADQPAGGRAALLPMLFCPTRKRVKLIGDAGAGSGVLGDYGAVAGDGLAGWTGPRANGAMILADVKEKKERQILRWQGHVTFDDLKRGRSYTLLLGEKHVPAEELGNATLDDAPIYNGTPPAASARPAGPDFPLANGPFAPYQMNFGSYHPRLCQFLYADLTVRTVANDINPKVLGELATRE